MCSLARLYRAIMVYIFLHYLCQISNTYSIYGECTGFPLGGRGRGLETLFYANKKTVCLVKQGGGAGLAEKEGLMGEDFLKTYSFVKTWGLTNREV